MVYVVVGIRDDLDSVGDLYGIVSSADLSLYVVFGGCEVDAFGGDMYVGVFGGAAAGDDAV